MVDKEHLKEIEGREMRLKKIDELIGRLNFVVETIEPLLWDIVSEYYKNIKTPKEMKDFLKDDPVFKFVLNHKIPDGLKRNSVLFKNLAIAFVHADLNDSEIREYAQKIVANCPGKNINEFLGWVKTVRKKPSEWEYNEAEMNDWIKMVNAYEG